MANILVSVVIPAYNEEGYILPCLNSVVNQNFPKDKFEIIVVNNNSTDNTEEMVKKNFPQIKVINEFKQGVVFARIKGVSEAKGKIIVFTDADCLAPQNWLKKITHAYQNPKVIAVGGKINFSPKTKVVSSAQFFGNIYVSLFQSIPCSNFSFLKTAYLNCGGFDPSINTGEDVYLSKQLKKIGKLKILKDNAITTSPRHLLAINFRYGIKYVANMFSVLVFKRPIMFYYKAIRDKNH